ncbi:PKD domain-containing protein [bacterium]|nr:PKD domain-containing protein [bacterium]
MLPGVERFLEAGTVSDLGEASRLESGTSGSGEVAWAMYRLELDSAEPGAIALDVNLPLRSDGSASSYFVGLSDYSSLRWEWHGPYSDNHVRLARAASPGPDVMAADSYLSALGNSFVTIVAYDGSRADVLALETETLDSADLTAPPVPQGLSLTPVAGGLSLQWNGVIADDLAGYRVYFSGSSFSSPSDPGVSSAGYVEASTRMLLSDLAGQCFVRISALDHNGNESALSAEASASPLAGSPPVIGLSLAQPSVLRTETAVLSVQADAALLLDYDLDGDGSFEISGSSQTSQNIDTTSVGIIRPLVRASSVEGDFQAYGGVSLIVAGNSRPVADAIVNPASGPAPLQVNFDGTASTDFDGSVVGGGWDFDGDGVYEVFDANSTAQLSVQHTYNSAGLFNAKLKVVDDQGDFDVDSVSILAEGAAPNLPPVAHVLCDVPVVILGQLLASVDPILDASASYDPEGGALEFAFDPEADGFFTSYSSSSSIEAVYESPGNYLVATKVRDTAGLEALGYCLVRVKRFAPVVPTSGHSLNGNTSTTALAALSSLVGIAYNNITTDDLLFLRSTDRMATDWLAPITVDASGGEWMSFAQDASQFNLAYFRDGDLFFKASQNDGGSFNVTGTPDNTVDNAGNFCSCALVAGRPAIAYHNATSGALLYVRAANSSGSGAWEASVLVDDTGNTGLYTCLTNGATGPMIAYYRQDNGNLLVVNAANSTGSSWNSPIIVDSNADDVGLHASLLASGITPSIAYFNDTDNALQYVKANDILGTSWGTPVVAATGNINSIQLVRVNGYHSIFFGDNGSQTRFVRSVDFDATQWGAPVTIEGDGAGALVSCSVSSFDQLPMVSYYDSVSQQLHFARPRVD